MSRKRYCLVGTGERGIHMFVMPLVMNYADTAELVGISDRNQGRLAYTRRLIGHEIPAYTDFDEMLAAVDCDAVIVTTKDSTHHEFIIKALESGKDVITEKPMTIDEEKCRMILAAEKRTGRKVRVTFNYRYAPFKSRIKELLLTGIVGQITLVEFRWFLDTVHGANYYRRWHAEKRNSGGLLVHKATHHFDLVNWWTGQEPVEVFAEGSSRFYGPTRMKRGERCLHCQHEHTCEFYLDLRTDGVLRELYLENEQYDGYIRDSCVFSPRIDIEDTMSAFVWYRNNMLLSYSLTSYAPFEGWTIAFNGTKGRLEATEEEAFISAEQRILADRAAKTNRYPADWYRAGFGSIAPKSSSRIRFYPIYGGVQSFEVEKGVGGHGGGDPLLLDMLFRDNVSDPLGQAADSLAAARSLLIGVAANKSMADRRKINIDRLLTGL